MRVSIILICFIFFQISFLIRCSSKTDENHRIRTLRPNKNDTKAKRPPTADFWDTFGLVGIYQREQLEGAVAPLHTFFYKNQVYKNHRGSNLQKLRIS